MSSRYVFVYVTWAAVFPATFNIQVAVSTAVNINDGHFEQRCCVASVFFATNMYVYVRTRISDIIKATVSYKVPHYTRALAVLSLPGALKAPFTVSFFLLFANSRTYVYRDTENCTW